MARRSYDRMFKDYDSKNEENKLEDVKINEKPKQVEEISLPKKDEGEKNAFQVGRVIGGLNLNVRKQPKADGEIIDTVKDGVTVQIMETINEEWYHIASPNGYVMSKYVQLV